MAADPWYEFWKQLPKTLPGPDYPRGVEPAVELRLAHPSGAVMLVLSAAGRYWLAVDIPQVIAGQPSTARRPLTPPLTMDGIRMVVEGVFVNNHHVITWAYTVRVLAVGAALGLTPPRMEAAALVLAESAPTDRMLAGEQVEAILSQAQ